MDIIHAVTEALDERVSQVGRTVRSVSVIPPLLRADAQHFFHAERRRPTLQNCQRLQVDPGMAGLRTRTLKCSESKANSAALKAAQPAFTVTRTVLSQAARRWDCNKAVRIVARIDVQGCPGLMAQKCQKGSARLMCEFAADTERAKRSFSKRSRAMRSPMGLVLILLGFMTGYAEVSATTPMHGPVVAGSTSKPELPVAQADVGLPASSRCERAPGARCSAWMEAATEFSVNVLALYAVAIRETGVRWTDGFVRPWPWTLNSPSTGPLFFRTYEESVHALRMLLARGEENIDVGVMQINLRAHKSRVSDPATLLLLRNNIHVGAQILREQLTAHREDWTVAFARYHSPRDELGMPYAAAVMRTLGLLTGSTRVALALAGSTITTPGPGVPNE